MWPISATIDSPDRKRSAEIRPDECARQRRPCDQFCGNGSKISQPPAVDHNNAGLKRLRVDVVVEDELLDSPRSIFRTEEKRAALASAVGAALQFQNASVPDFVGADDFRRMPE